MKLVVTQNLNVRLGSPKLSAPSNVTLPPGTIIEVNDTPVTGDKFQSSTIWLKDAAGNYYWAGGTNYNSKSREQEVFFATYAQAAKDSMRQTKVPASITLAQAALESQWGKSAPGNNFFGIKANTSWKGKTQKLKTWECGKTGNPTTDGIHDELIATYAPTDPAHPTSMCVGKYAYRVYGLFRAYDTPAEGFTDHGQFLRDNSRYKPCFLSTTAAGFARELQKAGYASDPTYAKALIAMSEKYGLAKYDSLV
jgi:flagellum-specific peptidoglycan hydrolase FlgJ